jgi:TPR repeat protein
MGNAISVVRFESSQRLLISLDGVKRFFDLLVLKRLYNSRYKNPLFSFTCVPPRVPRPFTGDPVENMSLAHTERLIGVSLLLKSKLVERLSVGMGMGCSQVRAFSCTCKQMMLHIANRVAAGMAVAVRNDIANDAEELCVSGNCASAVGLLNLAMHLGDTYSCARMAYILIHGRKGIPQDMKKGFALAEAGTKLGCCECAGVLAIYNRGYGCERNIARSYELAFNSSKDSNKYSLYALAIIYFYGNPFVPKNLAKALEFFQQAAAQNLDLAYFQLGIMYSEGNGVDPDLTEAVRYWRLAAIQGYPEAIWTLAECYENRRGVPCDIDLAIYWYNLALEAGDTDAADKLKMLNWLKS